MKDLMMLYGVTLGRRYKREEKVRFIETISIFFQKLGYPVNMQSKKTNFMEVNNIIIGDLFRAKKVLVAAYDTPSKILLPNYHYYPFNTKRNLRQENINLVLRFLIACILLILVFFLLKGLMGYQLWLKIVTVLFSFIMIFFAYRSLKGGGNQINFNRNSTAIVLMHTIARSYEKDDLAIVMLDHGVSSYEGLKLLKEEFDGKHQEVIMLEALANGEQVIMVARGKVNIDRLQNNRAGITIFNKVYEEMKQENNFLSFFPNMMYLGSGENKDKQFVVKNTRSCRDNEVNMERLEKINNLLLDYLRGE